MIAQFNGATEIYNVEYITDRTSLTWLGCVHQ